MMGLDLVWLALGGGLLVGGVAGILIMAVTSGGAMNIGAEIERLTTPNCAASPVRYLPQEEVERLLESGKITPVEEISLTHSGGRVCFPVHWFRGRYGLDR